MTFEIVPIIDVMIDFYKKPRSAERFKDYLKLLHGNTNNNLELPISGFNPMAKEHVLDKLFELKQLDAENIIYNTLEQLNKKLEINNRLIVKVVLNLSDDLKGGWTNYYTSDYDSKFKINALIH